MRLQVELNARLVAQIDRRFGRRNRSAFIGETVRRALDDDRRWDDVLASLGTIKDTGHEWDNDVAAWVRRQRH